MNSLHSLNSPTDLKRQAGEIKRSLTLAYEANGVRVSPPEFYAIACDPARNVAIEACAGAGKTWILVSRMLRILLETDCKPHEILAMTFTKKAAAEMLERLQELLQALAQCSPAECAAELVLRGIAEGKASELVNKAQGLYGQWLATPRQAQIRTFHSWFAALLQAAPLAVLRAMRIPLEAELQEDNAAMKAKTWQPFFSAVEHNAALRRDFDAVVAGYGRAGVLSMLGEVIDKQVDFQFALQSGALHQSVRTWQAQFASFADAKSPEAAIQLPWVREVLEQAAQSLVQATQLTRQKQGQALQSALQALFFIQNPLSKEMGQARAAFFLSLLTLKGEARKLGDAPQVLAAQDLLIEYRDLLAQHEAWALQERMARLGACLLEQYQEVKLREGWIDMADVERAAHALLTNEQIAGWMQERLDARVRQLLVDEFQDTNPLQWQALSNWLSSYAGAGAGQDMHVFLVGDPKQSIYRFRRAQPQVFVAAKEFIKAQLGGTVLSADHTRRNAPAVIAAVNGVMGDALLQAEIPAYRAHSTQSEEEGGVFFLPEIPREALSKSKKPEQNLDEDEEDGNTWRDSFLQPKMEAEERLVSLEAAQVADAIAALMDKGEPPSEVMVLARKRAPLMVLRDALRTRGIAAQLGEKSELIESVAVQDMVALLDVLVSTGQDLALARVLKSPLFALEDAQLTALAEVVKASKTQPLDKKDAEEPSENQNQNQNTHTWWNALRGFNPSIFATLTRWRRLVQDLPVHDALQCIYEEGDVLARYLAAAPTPQRLAMKSQLVDFLQAALDWQSGRFVSAYAFVRAMKKGGIVATPLAEGDAVRLFTIHGAKGLEANVVFVMDTQAAPQKRESMTTLIDWRGQDRSPHLFAFLSSEARPAASLLSAVQSEQRAKQLEEMNALYVAMTRARRTLVFSSCAPRGQHKSWWQRLLPFATPAAFTPCARIASTASASTQNPLPGEQETSEFWYQEAPTLSPALRRSSEKLEVSTDVAAQNSEQQATVESRMGQAMHKLLEWASNGGLEGLVLPAHLLQELQSRFDLSAEQVSKSYENAKRIRFGDCAWAWDAAQVDWASDELEFLLSAKEDDFQVGEPQRADTQPASTLRTVRIDRLVRRKGDATWWILDYKSSLQPAKNLDYQAQMEVYRLAVQSAYPRQVVRTLLIGADGKAWEMGTAQGLE